MATSLQTDGPEFSGPSHGRKLIFPTTTTTSRIHGWTEQRLNFRKKCHPDFHRWFPCSCSHVNSSILGSMYIADIYCKHVYIYIDTVYVYIDRSPFFIPKSSHLETSSTEDPEAPSAENRYQPFLSCTFGWKELLLMEEIRLHLARLTWNLRINPWKRRNIFQTIIFRFYVNLGGCNHLGCPKNPSSFPRIGWVRVTIPS